LRWRHRHGVAPSRCSHVWHTWCRGRTRTCCIVGLQQCNSLLMLKRLPSLNYSGVFGFAWLRQLAGTAKHLAVGPVCNLTCGIAAAADCQVPDPRMASGAPDSESQCVAHQYWATVWQATALRQRAASQLGRALALLRRRWCGSNRDANKVQRRNVVFTQGRTDQLSLT
jgi:hypothetical protein